MGYLKGQKTPGPGERGQASLEQLNEEYERAEAILPTRFREYEERSREEYFLVKNNYYYLFELAEQIKKIFFQAQFQYELWVSTKKEEKRTGRIPGQVEAVCYNGWPFGAFAPGNGISTLFKPD